ncbi:MAG: hypothetical protein ING65_03535 [Rhodocyclaceae bacterium]|nr:hypothetical protein [Rhodocyclaceae bacterium]
MGRSSAALGDAVLGSSSKSSCIPIYIPVFRCSPPSLAGARDEARPIIWPGLAFRGEAGHSFAEALASRGEAESIIWDAAANRRDVEYLFAEPLAIWENAPC